MKFELSEYYSAYSRLTKFKEVLEGILLIFIFPFFYVRHLFAKIKGSNEAMGSELNTWKSYAVCGSYSLESRVLKNEEVEALLEGNQLDHPDWLDWDDPFRDVMKFRAFPEIPALSEAHFDEVDLKTEQGIYLIRFNPKSEGMTLCFLANDEARLIEVTNLRSLTWVLSELKPGLVQADGYANKGVYQVLIKEVE
ncbi:hypothetical protein [Croceimicrobium hydrocarbonivorans]|uniref:Uncharacterized protein n=1 Tax=Croceimicrobium hydrocarbonivorans TaxID=2761580 RepID=A0A7H0VHR1_9FLAO|nr:hypothetical protein [Croceimicrobium hydrocarbonivorans]QNR25259.1 hypothetical protein H4K34_05315 [Croceimicrobium hydrocarbonivorans]